MIEITFIYSNGIKNTVRTNEVISFVNHVLYIGNIKFVDIDAILLIKKAED